MVQEKIRLRRIVLAGLAGLFAGAAALGGPALGDARAPVKFAHVHRHCYHRDVGESAYPTPYSDYGPRVSGDTIDETPDGEVHFPYALSR